MKDKSITRIKELITTDRMNVKEEFFDMVLADFIKVFSEYFDVIEEPKMSIEKSEKCFEIKLIAKAVSCKQFMILPE